MEQTCEFQYNNGTRCTSMLHADSIDGLCVFHYNNRDSDNVQLLHLPFHMSLPDSSDESNNDQNEDSSDEEEELVYQSTCVRSECKEHVFYRLGRLCLSHLVENQIRQENSCNFPSQTGELCDEFLDLERNGLCRYHDYIVTRGCKFTFNESGNKPECIEFFPDFICKMKLDGIDHKCTYVKSIHSIKGNCCRNYDHI